MDFRVRYAGKVLRQQREEGVAQERDAGQHADVARARIILAPDRIAAPVIANLDAAPVTAHQRLPLRQRVIGRLRARDVVTRLGDSVALFLVGHGAAHDDDAAGEGKLRRARLEGKSGEGAHFYSAATAGRLDKKGGAGRASNAAAAASNACACASSEGWLPLT